MPEYKLPQFHIDLPDTWEDHSAYVFIGRQHAGRQHVLTLVLDRSPVQDDLEKFGRERVAALVGTISEQDLVKEGIITLPSGAEAYDCVYKWIPSDDQVIFKRIVCLLIDSTGYVFSIDFTKASLKTVGLEVMQLIDSVTPIEDA